MADLKVYVDGTDNAGTFHFLTLKAATDYMVANYPNLTANNGSGGAGKVEYEISITGAETASVTVSGFTTSAASHISIYTTSAARHSGVWTTDKYRIVLGASGHCLTIADAHVRVDGIQAHMAVAPEGHYYSVIAAAETGTDNCDIRISNCILRASGTSSYIEHCIFANLGKVTSKLYLWNNICYGVGTYSYAETNAALRTQGSSASYVWNCVFSSGKNGVCSDNVMTAKNSYAYGGVKGWYVIDTLNTSYCASNTTELGGTGDIDSVAKNTTQFVNVTAGSEDFHLAGTGSALYGVGGDNTADSAPLNFTTDIDGHTITGRFDIGADWVAPTAQFARPSSDVAGGTFRSILVTAPFGPRVIA